MIENVGNHVMLLLEPIDDRNQLRVASLQMWEHAAVLERVVPGDEPAVLRTVGAERPVVLADRHLVDERARVTGIQRPLPTCSLRYAAVPALRAGHRGCRSVLRGGLLVGRVPAAGVRLWSVRAAALVLGEFANRRSYLIRDILRL